MDDSSLPNCPSQPREWMYASTEGLDLRGKGVFLGVSVATIYFILLSLSFCDTGASEHLCRAPRWSRPACILRKEPIPSCCASSSQGTPDSDSISVGRLILCKRSTCDEVRWPKSDRLWRDSSKDRSLGRQHRHIFMSLWFHKRRAHYGVVDLKMRVPNLCFTASMETGM